LLPLFIVTGALAGLGTQGLLRVAGMEEKLASALTYLQGDPSYINPETGLPAYEASNLLNNWPQWFGDYPQHVGWFIGTVIGIAAYFIYFGKFRNGSSLFTYMGSGWLLSFLAFPVLGSLFFEQYGGIRMTPPRADDWAGILGVFAGTSFWMWRNNLKPVAAASLISGTIGGLGFTGIQWLKQLMMSFGNPRILEAKGILPGTEEFISITSKWADWQSQNWHSFLEQSYGFVNGIAIAAALGFLASRVKIHQDKTDDPTYKNGRWTVAFSALFVMLGLTYFNMVKNVAVWSEQLSSEMIKKKQLVADIWVKTTTLPDGSAITEPAKWDLPYLGRLPGIDFLHLTPTGWFNLTWAILTIACIFIVIRHYKNPLSIIPKNRVAKGQIIYLIVLWVMVIANFERALTGWHPSRMLTEWVIFINAIIATVLVIILPQESGKATIKEEKDYKPVYKWLWVKALGVFVISCFFFLGSNRLIYHYPTYDKLDKKRYHTRFGPEASWKSKPNLKNAEHK
jgi:hypothetical protein